MTAHLKKITRTLKGDVFLTSSKSESNRALIIKALADTSILLKNLSEARDTQTMIRLLSSQDTTWDVLDAGTTMRFCTAYLAVRGNGHTITGTDRMKQRPIGLLVDALSLLGSKIDYLDKPGFPPLQIHQLQKQATNEITIPGNISSQYISALMLIAPVLPHGLTITLTGTIYSFPYLEMTRKLMAHFGAVSQWDDNRIVIQPGSYISNTYTIESDWSGASYWYSFCALNPGSEIQLHGLRKDSFQGDQAIAVFMDKMGVKTTYNDQGVLLNHQQKQENTVTIDFKNCPDLAQTVLVVASCRGIKLEMTGLESLRIKETDRIVAMQTELQKLNGSLLETSDHWTFVPGEIPSTIEAVETYDDHRMAMAFAPVACLRNIHIKEPDVVKKSYPGFWSDIEKIGIELIIK